MKWRWWVKSEKLSKKEMNALKARIEARLRKENYTCRLPKIKPRVRYKLRTFWYWAGDERRWVWR